ncbi:MAG: hypothetical protein H8E84_00340 [Flavobacteriales bacterium]|nr:hypothetical protein [Flavobacteriales bacterium]
MKKIIIILSTFFCLIGVVSAQETYTYPQFYYCSNCNLPHPQDISFESDVFTIKIYEEFISITCKNLETNILLHIIKKTEGEAFMVGSDHGSGIITIENKLCILLLDILDPKTMKSKHAFYFYNRYK